MGCFVYLGYGIVVIRGFGMVVGIDWKNLVYDEFFNLVEGFVGGDIIGID